MSLQTRSDYYASLLAYLYRGLPNATRQVQLWCVLMTGENLPDQLLSAFDLDTAVGQQLDILGKYIGVARNVGIVQVRPYFGLWSTSLSPGSPAALDATTYQSTWNPTTNIPALVTSTSGYWWVASSSGTSTSPTAATWLAGDVLFCSGGASFTKYSLGSPNGNGLTSSSDASVNANGVFYSTAYLSGQNSDLTDAQYRTVLKLKIAQNSSDGTLAGIMGYLNGFFPGLISLVDNKNMTLSYFVVSTIALSQELLEIYLPRPMAVGISVTIVSPIPGGGDTITTESGDALETEGGEILITEGT